jgi:methylmalonyl-CoA mutase N-terminal domain/subunit
MSARASERPPTMPVVTDSGIEVLELYTDADLGDAESLAERLGTPGTAPFTRGPYPSMYRGQLWTMRQFAGFGSPQESNQRFHYLLSRGQTALSVAFDLPTQLGYDSTHPAAGPEVGRVGVAIDTVEDMVDLFAGLPLDRVSVNFTINATAPIILALYLVAAERQGVAYGALSGTLQNDILKEFLARKTFIFPPGPSLRLTGDVVEFASRELPRFNPISITGYHAREAGCDAVQELAFTMSDAIAYCDLLIARGLDFDEFASRLSFHFSTTLDLFEEVAKLRAARRLWHSIATERFGAVDPASGRLRFFSGNSGATLTAQQPLNNLIRSTVQCLGAVLGGAQSIHVMGYDEAYEIPSEQAVTLSLRTQQILAYECGVARTADPLAGSYFVESLTDEVERRARVLIEEIDAQGGAAAVIERGLAQRWIAESAYRYECAVRDGLLPKVGVNCFVEEGASDAGELHHPDPGSPARQAARTAEFVARRGDAASGALEDLSRDVADGRNVMPSLIVAARAGATLGEMSDVFRRAFGEFEEPSLW